MTRSRDTVEEGSLEEAGAAAVAAGLPDTRSRL